MKNILFFGDSNTYGFRPDGLGRYDINTRWTGIVSKKLKKYDVNCIEEGLCGRTTSLDDRTRQFRNGLKTLPLILESHKPVDLFVLMLGTNDLKAYFEPSAKKIAGGIEKILSVVKVLCPSAKILVISPIELGSDIVEKDPEFNAHSLEVSKELKFEIQKTAFKNNVSYFAASDAAVPSFLDAQHMDEKSHASFGKALSKYIEENFILINK